MKVLRTAQAGSLESQDILITVKKGKTDSGVIIELDSPSNVQYGRQIRNEINIIIADMGIEDVHIQAIDKGALGFTIKARTETALKRATAEKEDLVF
ncbi:MAG: citrate lyase acyl carrier protein [Asgard group archaeon]|nr:citrate lyase acyl carrier protein [Asgard group archaeon]